MLLYLFFLSLHLILSVAEKAFVITEAQTHDPGLSVPMLNRSRV